MVLAKETLGVNLVDFLRARRTCCKPAILRDYLDSSDWVSVPGSHSENLLDLLTRNFCSGNVRGGQSFERSLLFGSGGSIYAFVDRVSEVVSEFAINFARIFAQAGRHFCREQARNNSVLVRTPNTSVTLKESRTGTFLARKTQTAGEQSFDEPLEAHRDFIECPLEPRADTINHAAANYGLSDSHVLGPILAIGKQVVHADRKVMIRGQQPTSLGDYAVAVVIRIAGKRNIKLISQADESLHGIWRRRIHANLSVPIDTHEAKRRINGFVDDCEVEPVLLGNPWPIIDACASEGIHSKPNVCIVNGIQVDDTTEILDIGAQKVVLVCRGRVKRFLEGDSLYALQRPSQEFIGFRFDPESYARIGRSSMRRIVLKTAVAGRVVRGRDYDTVCETGLSTSVVTQNRMRDGRCWGICGGFGQHHFHIVGREHFHRARKCRFGQGVRIYPKEQRTVDALEFAVVTDGLRDGQDVPLVEGHVERRSAMAGCTEGHALPRVARIRPELVVGR